MFFEVFEVFETLLGIFLFFCGLLSDLFDVVFCFGGWLVGWFGLGWLGFGVFWECFQLFFKAFSVMFSEFVEVVQ